MHTLLALIAAALACALARPPVVNHAPPSALPRPQWQRIPVPFRPEYYQTLIVPRYPMPHEVRYKVPMRSGPRQNSFLDREISIINRMKTLGMQRFPYAIQYPRRIPKTTPLHTMPVYANPMPYHILSKHLSKISRIYRNRTQNLAKKPQMSRRSDAEANDQKPSPKLDKVDAKTIFALTPLQAGYYETTTSSKITTPAPKSQPEEVMEMVYEPRQIRQNPNLSKTKSLVAENLDRLRTGFTHEEVEGTAKSHHVHVLETPTADPADSIYGVALVAAVGAALTMAIIGFAVGWYTLSRKAKAAADVDYPAYGVTGPTVDNSGDRKLAQSAHMYHYQHQKQQILAMERNGMDHRNASISDPESEEENEEGDYTVYECPGFATTGDMEVKNPLFEEETPATPAKSDAGKAEPKE